MFNLFYYLFGSPPLESARKSNKKHFGIIPKSPCQVSSMQISK